MTTETPWSAFELIGPAGPGQRSEALIALSESLGRGLSELKARTAVAYYWTQTGVPDAPLARAKGFWKASRDLAATIPSTAALSEAAFLRADGLHFIGSAHAPLAELPRLVLSVHRYARNRACILVPLGDVVPLDAAASIADVLSTARFELQVVRALRARALGWRCVVVVPAGRFDDPEACLVLTGPVVLADSVEGLSEISSE